MNMKTIRNKYGCIHTSPEITIYTGRHEHGKYAGFALPSMLYVPACIFKRGDAAKIIRHHRKGGKSAN
jgi:hypothetical protein